MKPLLVKMYYGKDMNVHKCLVRLWFKDFLFTYETEYLVCDWTCLLGEVGGNLGFFMGGSLLALGDAIIKLSKKKIGKITGIGK